MVRIWRTFFQSASPSKNFSFFVGRASIVVRRRSMHDAVLCAQSFSISSSRRRECPICYLDGIYVLSTLTKRSGGCSRPSNFLSSLSTNSVIFSCTHGGGLRRSDTLEKRELFSVITIVFLPSNLVKMPITGTERPNESACNSHG
jgi:hypothetical protein